MSQVGTHTNAQIEEGLVRHMVLNTIRSIRQKFIGHGELVIASDNRKYWRREIYSHYKANRKKAREATDTDWQAIFDCLNKIRNELYEFFPYRVINVERAEADDIIGTLCMKFGTVMGGEKIVIVSGDKDFVQLQTFGNVEQYDPVNKKLISHPAPDRFLMEHIMKGDRGDGIPNFLSSDDCLVTGERQKSLQKAKLESWVGKNPLDFCTTETMLRGYKRNEQLIDLRFIPEEVQQAVLEEFEKQANKSRDKLFNYFVHNKLKTLMESIGDY
jgi:hypothetical protein